MDVTVNGDPRTVEADTSVKTLIGSTLDDRPSLDGIAVAINEEVLPRSAWDTTSLSGGDRIEILTARQGG